MVLLSFFILFFSVDEKEEHIFHEILKLGENEPDENNDIRSQESRRHQRNVANLGSSPSHSTLLADDKGEEETIESKGKIPLMVLMNQTFSQTGWSTQETKQNELVFQMPDNIFELNSYSLNMATQLKLQDFVKRIKPYSKYVNIYFIGHSDSSPVFARKEKTIQNNFDMSSRRALQALSYALLSGMPRERVFIQGAAELTRNTRSISIIVRERDVIRE